MKYKIEKHLTKTNKGAKGKNNPQWIVVHFVGASGQAWDNANYFNSVYRGASAHYFVDAKTIVQVVEDDTPAWHVGDGSVTKQGANNGYVKANGATNNNAIGIELCQDTSTGKDVWSWQFHAETLNRAEELIKEKQKKYNIPDSRVIRHYDASGKKCPGNWADSNWAKWWEFKKRLAGVKDNKPTGTVSKDEGKPVVNGKTHTVKAGETLGAIAKKYGVTINNLIAWNDIANANLIFPETVLFVAEPKKPAEPKTNIEKMAIDAIAGKYGSGEQRKKKLGKDYDKVQKRVNELLQASKATPKPVAKPAPKPTPKPAPVKKAKFNLPTKSYWHKTPQFKGSDITVIQQALSSVHFYPDVRAKNKGVDGYYGAKTADAVRRFQSMYGLKQDGIYGASTRAQLDKMANK